MAYDIRKIKDTTDLIGYFSENLGWNIDMDYVDDIEDISYDFTAADIGLKDDAFARISALRQMQPLVDGQKWGIFCVEFDSQRFEVGALRKILSKLIPRRRNSADHAVWDQQDLLFICNWGNDNNRTIGLAHFEDQGTDLPQIRMISCAPAKEDFTQIKVFEDRLSLLRWPKDTSNIEEWRRTWASAFTTGYREVIQTSALLTTRLAAEAQNIRNHILEILEVETRNGYVHLLFDKFRNTLIHDMSETQFADMYAQTVVYGLFSARCMDTTQENFSASEAVDCIPNTNPFLKNLMRECLGANDRSRLSFDELEIGNVVELLRNTRTDSIIQDFNRQTGGGREDPVIHFYEEFLTAYDKAQKVQRGVYYTPQPVVNFIVRAVDDILKTEFGLPEGLASTATRQIKVQRKSERKVNGMYRMVEANETVPAVQVLDPATGTGTFLRQVILQIYENFKQQHRGESKEAVQKAWNEYVPKYLLPRLNGFELMMAPYAVAHMKLAMVLKDTGYNFKGQGRLNVCLTNTLEAPGNSDDQISIFDDDPLAMESIEANKVKKNTGINVILGNPPYSSSSSNKGNWILDLISAYKKNLNERKINLDDDYIKFIRFAHHMIDTDGTGIVAYISNNSFLDGVTHRTMRKLLMQSFQSIYIINLHGNAKKKETTPSGGKDENVFDIQQGVSINIFVKTRSSSSSGCSVKSYDLTGLRQEKYEFLSKRSLRDIEFTALQPKDDIYFFVPRDDSASTTYNKGIQLTDLFPLYNSGIQTKCDRVVVQDSMAAIHSVIDDFTNMGYEALATKYGVSDDGPGWKLSKAVEDIKEHDVKILEYLYRPFDIRYTAYTGNSSGFMGRPRDSVMSEFMHQNIGLITCRFQTTFPFQHAFVTNTISDLNSISMQTGEQSFVFPLFLRKESFGRIHYVPNIDIDAARLLLGKTINLQEINDKLSYQVFYYVYAVLFAPTYRKKYKELLKSGFPVIPKAPSTQCFEKMVSLGEALVNCHLLKSEGIDGFVCESSIIDSTVMQYEWRDDKVFINKTSYFANIPSNIWEMYIGGYQPLQKWLKERKKHSLSTEEILHFSKMVKALIDTEKLMVDIDCVYIQSYE